MMAAVAAKDSSRVVGLRVDRVSYERAVDRIIEAARSGDMLRVAAANVHVVMEARADPTLAVLLSEFELVVADGQPIRWMLDALRQRAPRLTERVYGPELMRRVCHAAADAGLAVYLFGATDHTLERLEQQLKTWRDDLIIAGRHAPGFGDELWASAQQDAERIRSSGAQLLLVGLGCPRQERWVGVHGQTLNIPCLAVGAAFDLWAGNKPMAPPWMQRAGLEWAFRLANEPRRTFRRYAWHNPRFIALALAQLLSRRG